MEEVKEQNVIKGKDAGIAFSLSAVLPVAVTYLVAFILMAVKKYDDVKDNAVFNISTYLLTQAGLAITLFIAKGLNKNVTLKNLCGFKRFDYRVAFLIPFVAFGTIFGLGFLNDYFVDGLKKIGLKVSGVSISMNNAGELVFALFAIAVVPAVLEEIVFRSVILKGTSGDKPLVTLLVCAFAFSLYHHNPAQTVYQFVVGWIYAYIAITTKSVLPTVILHVVNNAFVILFNYFVGDFLFGATLTAIFVTVGILALAICFVVYRFAFKMKAERSEEKADFKSFFLFSAVGIVVLVAEWIVGCL